MMPNPEAIALPKWPFIAGDVLLLALAAWLGWEARPLSEWHLAAVVSCVLSGGILGVLPFVLEHRARLRLAEVRGLAGITEQMNHLRSFSNQISFATAQWQVAQEHGEKTLASAKEITERITAEAKSFSEFLRSAGDDEKRQLQLELEKLRKSEVEWLQITVRLLDQVYALHQAGLRSGQTRLIDQLTRFQHVCRDITRRVGLVPFEPSAGEPYNEALHKVHPDAKDQQCLDGQRVEHTIAPGFRFQGQVLRPAIVAIAAGDKTVETPERSEDAALPIS